MRIRYRFEDRGAREATKKLRQQIGKEARAAMREVAERSLVPPARRRAPSTYAAWVRPYATNRGAGVRIAAPRGSTLNGIAGWLEFGGRIHARVGGYLRFQVRGRWVQVRYVQRPFVKGGRYVGAAMRDPAVVRGATDEVREQVRLILTRYLGDSAEVTR